MQIYLIRHAHAVDATEDSKRPLSKKGHKQIKRLAKFLRGNQALATGEFWHSPLARSRETAELLTAQIGAPAKLLEVVGLEGTDDPAKIAGCLKARKTPVAIVGHEPHLTALASLLVVGATEPPRFVLKKSAAIALERSEGGWAVRWQISPELLA
jgi:phosphohistidine phosphatase